MTQENQVFDFESIPFAVSLVGEVTREDNWTCDQWRVTIGPIGYHPGNVQFTSDYFTGIGHRKLRKGVYMPTPPYRKGTIGYEKWEKDNMIPVKPSVKDVMYSLLLDSSASDENFNDWCDNYSYDSDSIKALNIYKACLDTAEKLRKVFSRDQLNAMRDVLQDY